MEKARCKSEYGSQMRAMQVQGGWKEPLRRPLCQNLDVCEMALDQSWSKAVCKAPNVKGVVMDWTGDEGKRTSVFSS